MTTLARVIAALGLLFVVRLLWGSRRRDEGAHDPAIRLAVKHPWLIVGAMAATIGAFAALTLISGIVPIKASPGHWRATTWLLDFAKTRSVSTHSWGIEVPPLDDDALILRGAGHYENGCLPCHGAPGRPIPPVIAAMTPPPPQLDRRVARWQPEELFSIVKHGIKFTGMPAWPVQQRDDEVWSMVAFLRRLPQLDRAAYRRLAYGEPDDDTTRPAEPSPIGREPPPRAVRDLCRRCHGLTGTGRGPGAFPSLAGQRAAYLAASLRAFRERSRFSGIMSEIAAKLDDEAVNGIAAYYEALPPRLPEPTSDGESVLRGRTLAAQGLPERDIPACIECHGPIAFPKNPAYPRLTAQHEMYLTSQLVLLQQRRRGGTSNVDLMHVFVSRLRLDEIRDVARYYASTAQH